MPAPGEPVTFEALCSPPPSLGAGGLKLVAALIGGLGSLIGVGFLWFGAWPVLGFFGAELVVVVGLLAAHRTRSARHPELVRLVGDTVEVGGIRLAAYWTRVELASAPRGATRLLLRDRTRTVEIGRALGEADRRDLAAALRAALAAHREPRFANPQLAVSRSAPGS
jgi:uncharacterized membrane protein